MIFLVVFEGSRDEAVFLKEVRVFLGLDVGCFKMIFSFRLVFVFILLIF